MPELDEDELEDAPASRRVALPVMPGYPPLAPGASAGGLIVSLPLLLGGGLVSAATPIDPQLAAGWLGVGCWPEAQAWVPFPIPAWAWMVSLPFAWLGLCGTVSTVVGVLRQALRLQTLAAHPDEPWRGDHPWGQRGGHDRLRFKLSTPLKVLLYALFLLPFHVLYQRLASGSGEWIAGGALALFDLTWLASAGYTLYALGRSLKYRGARLEWSGVPFLVGQPLQVAFRLPAALRALRDPPTLVFTLRALSEGWKSLPSGQGQQTHTQLAVTPLVQLEQRERADRSDDEGRLQLTFTPPPGSPGTQLAPGVAGELIYWELEVQAETPGIDYRGLFLLPVY